MKGVRYFKEEVDCNVVRLTMLYITSLLANLTFGYRYTSVSGFPFSGGIFIFPLSFVISDIATEIYGTRYATKLINNGIIAQLIFAFYGYMVVHIPAPPDLQHPQWYFAVFNPYLHFAFASTVSIWLGTYINVKLLSKFSTYVSGKYFALRSLLASTIGELFVTVISMLIANIGRLRLSHLLFMAMCCFVLKTVISFIAIWPASIVVAVLNKTLSVDIGLNKKNIMHPFSYIKKLVMVAWYAGSYIYRLESIDMQHKTTSLMYRGTRSSPLKLPLQEVVLDQYMIKNTSAEDASHLGFYYGYLACDTDKELKFNQHLMKNKKRGVYLREGQYNILLISRDKKITLYSPITKEKMTRTPIALYRNAEWIKKLDATQASYVSYLAGVAERKLKNRSSLRHVPLSIVKE